jgi:anti-sigma factor RsiW
MSESERAEWEQFLAASRARRAFYKALQAEAERAFERGADLPEVPPNHELTFVDGFLVWKGRPVWWSGESRSSAASAELRGPGLLNEHVLARGTPLRSPATERPSLRRWLSRHWRALAYGHAL